MRAMSEKSIRRQIAVLEPQAQKAHRLMGEATNNGAFLAARARWTRLHNEIGRLYAVLEASDVR